MSLQAGFAEINIDPQSFPARSYWAPVDSVIDPLFAHASVFRDESGIVALLSLDVVIVEREYVLKIREQISRACPIPPDCIMVCATHNHACPAVVERPWSQKDDQYLDYMVAQGAKAVLEAYKAMTPVEMGTGSSYEGRISFNRRFIMKNGSVISHPPREIMEQSILFGESIIDPQVGVLCVRDLNHNVIGLLVNFACHAVHLMGSLSAGFPGVLADQLKKEYGEHVICVFLNGACGNVHHNNHSDPEQEDTKEKMGSILATDVIHIVKGLDFSSERKVSATTAEIQIRYREIEGLAQNIDNLESFNVFKGLIERKWYPWSLERLRTLHEERDYEDVEIQVISIGDTVFGAVPAEYFCQHSLRIKEQSPVAETFVVSLANGWLGYIPHREAFNRIGGHESTWCISSKMEPDAGDLIAEALLKAIATLSRGKHGPVTASA